MSTYRSGGAISWTFQAEKINLIEGLRICRFRYDQVNSFSTFRQIFMDISSLLILAFWCFAILKYKLSRLHHNEFYPFFFWFDTLDNNDNQIPINIKGS